MKPILYYRIKDLLHHTGSSWDALATDPDHAIAFAHEHINPEPPRMLDANHYSLEYCLAHSGESINDRFRQNYPDKIDLQIAHMVANNRTDKDLILYRGVSDSVYQLMKKNAMSLSDCDLYEKGFLATSLVKGHEINSKIKLRIYVPAGTKCIYQGNVNEEQFFYEVDVMHGTKLKVISIDSAYINGRVLQTA